MKNQPQTMRVSSGKKPKPGKMMFAFDAETISEHQAEEEKSQRKPSIVMDEDKVSVDINLDQINVE